MIVGFDGGLSEHSHFAETAAGRSAVSKATAGVFALGMHLM